MVPGVQVAQIDANKWAVSARGFNGRFANKLLVLIDGRSVYTPLFSGVYWDMHDLMLEDIDRIEVIRGPGATMWGSNAGCNLRFKGAFMSRFGPPEVICSVAGTMAFPIPPTWRSNSTTTAPNGETPWA